MKIGLPFDKLRDYRCGTVEESHLISYPALHEEPNPGFIFPTYNSTYIILY